MSPATRLPPIQLLPAFEAAARHMSFKAAAAELHVTPSAISQQIKALEAALGLVLFERQPRAVTLTEAGRLYLEIARETLETFQRGTALVRGRFQKRVLRLNADAAVVHELLIPALPSFESAHPELDLRLETSSALIDLRRDVADAALRFGAGPWPGVSSELIAAMVATPVASAELIARKPLRALSDLSAHVLLAVSDAPEYWQEGARRAGFRIRRGKTFDSYLATLHAASAGMGVALALLPLSAAWLHDGRLVAPLSLRIETGGYHFVCRPNERDRPDLAQLKAWLHACFADLTGPH